MLSLISSNVPKHWPAARSTSLVSFERVMLSCLNDSHASAVCFCDTRGWSVVLPLVSLPRGSILSATAHINVENMSCVNNTSAGTSEMTASCGWTLVPPDSDAFSISRSKSCIWKVVFDPSGFDGFFEEALVLESATGSPSLVREDEFSVGFSRKPTTLE